jgi:hypothetical protein
LTGRLRFRRGHHPGEASAGARNIKTETSLAPRHASFGRPTWCKPSVWGIFARRGQEDRAVATRPALSCWRMRALGDSIYGYALAARMPPTLPGLSRRFRCGIAGLGVASHGRLTDAIEIFLEAVREADGRVSCRAGGYFARTVRRSSPRRPGVEVGTATGDGYRAREDPVRLRASSRDRQSLIAMRRPEASSRRGPAAVVRAVCHTRPVRYRGLRVRRAKIQATRGPNARAFPNYSVERSTSSF